MNTISQFVLGGLIVVGQTYFANNSSPFMAGVIYSAPTLFLPSVLFIKNAKQSSDFAVHAALMVLALFVYDISYAFLINKYSKLGTIFLSFIPWAIMVAITGLFAEKVKKYLLKGPLTH